MIGTDRTKYGPASYQADSALDPMQGLGLHTGLIGGLLIAAGAVISVAMGVTRVSRLNLWLIATALYVTGALLVAMPHEKR